MIAAIKAAIRNDNFSFFSEKTASTPANSGQSSELREEAKKSPPAIKIKNTVPKNHRETFAGANFLLHSHVKYHASGEIINNSELNILGDASVLNTRGSCSFSWIGLGTGSPLRIFSAAYARNSSRP